MLASILMDDNMKIFISTLIRSIFFLFLGRSGLVLAQPDFNEGAKLGRSGLSYGKFSILFYLFLHLSILLFIV